MTEHTHTEAFSNTLFGLIGREKHTWAGGRPPARLVAEAVRGEGPPPLLLVLLRELLRRELPLGALLAAVLDPTCKRHQSRGS